MKRLFAVTAAMLIASSAFAATARWTGRMEYVTTVTYKHGISCEYDYFGQTFWRTFTGVGYCPASVEVQ